MAAEPRSTKASKKELQSLKDHFKDVGFQEYHLFNEDCKRHVMECLDSLSLIRIGMCSKTEQLLVAGTPWKISEIEIGQEEDRVDERLVKNETVEVTFDRGSRFRTTFKQIENSVHVETVEGRILWKRENAENFKEAVAFFECILNKCRYEVEKIVLNMGPKARDWAARDGSAIERLPNARFVELWHMDWTHQKFWLEKMPEHLESIGFGKDVTSDVVKLPQFRNARMLECCDRCDVTDALMLELNAVDVYITYAPLITARGLNAFLKKWQCGGGVGGFRKLEIRVTEAGVNIQDVIDGLEIALEIRRGVDDDNETNYVIRNKVCPSERLYVSTDGDSIEIEPILDTSDKILDSEGSGVQLTVGHAQS